MIVKQDSKNSLQGPADLWLCTCATAVAPHLSHVVGEKNDIRHELDPRFAKLKQVDDNKLSATRANWSIAKPVVHASDVLKS